MKSTGIVRRIDELGRIVIPKEVRKTLKIKSGDTIEIYISENSIILNKYSPISANVKEVEELCQTLRKVGGKSVFITDTEKVVCTSSDIKGYENMPITKSASKIISEKKSLIIGEGDSKEGIKLLENESDEVKNKLLVPIENSSGEGVGLIAMLDNDENNKFGTTEIKLLRLVSKLLQDKFLL